MRKQQCIDMLAIKQLNVSGRGLWCDDVLLWRRSYANVFACVMMSTVFGAWLN